MRILRFNMQPEPVSAARTGVLLGRDMIGDLRAGYAACLAQTSGDSHAREIAAMRLPPNINDILNTGGVTHAVIAETAAWLAQTLEKNPEAKGLAGEPLFSPLATSRLHAPIRPSKLARRALTLAGFVQRDDTELERVRAQLAEYEDRVGRAETQQDAATEFEGLVRLAGGANVNVGGGNGGSYDTVESSARRPSSVAATSSTTSSSMPSAL